MMLFLSIDLQGGFDAALKRHVIDAACEEVRRAMRFKYHIMFLEYDGFGSTLGEIKRLTKGYDKKVTVYKDDDDGGQNVLDAIFKYDIKANQIRTCGVNTDMCVHDTVRTISKLAPKTEIILRKDGCASCHKNDFSKFAKYKNVKIINGK